MASRPNLSGNRTQALDQRNSLGFPSRVLRPRIKACGCIEDPLNRGGEKTECRTRTWVR